MDLGVNGRNYLVIGGTAGMGLEAARALANDGARVVITGRDRSRAEAAAASIARTGGGDATVVVGDVATSQEAAEAIVAQAIAAVGPLSGIAITTGTNRSAHSTLEAATDDVWLESFQEVLMGTVHSVKAALPGMITAGGGTVVTTAAYSIRSPHGDRVPYVTLKSAVATFTKAIARTYGGRGIRANCICPGAIETDALASMREQLAAARGRAPEGLLEQVMREEWHMDVALGRPGRPEEVGELIALLLSDRAAYLTGSLINIDGGTEF